MSNLDDYERRLKEIKMNRNISDDRPQNSKQAEGARRRALGDRQQQN